MPISLPFALKPVNNARLAPNAGEQLHAAFIGLLAQSDKKLAAWAHDGQGRKVFALSPPWPAAGGGAWFRVAFIDDVFGSEAGKVLNQAGAAEASFTIGPARFTLARPTSPEYVWAAGAGTFADIAESAGLDELIKLRFLSPTTFDHGFSYPLPEPGLVFKSCLDCWPDPQLGVDRKALLAFIKERMRISRFKLRTQRVRFNDFPDFIGFLGEVVLKINKAKAADPAMVKQINALADFAFYCGTGAKTAMGMGQTVRVPMT